MELVLFGRQYSFVVTCLLSKTKLNKQTNLISLNIKPEKEEEEEEEEELANLKDIIKFSKIFFDSFWRGSVWNNYFDTIWVFI